MDFSNWIRQDANTYLNAQNGATITRVAGRLTLTIGNKTVDVTAINDALNLFASLPGNNPIWRLAQAQARLYADISNGGIPDGS